MKIVLFFALIAFAAAEFCDHDSDCKITQCGANFRLDCYERDHSHECTCIPTHNQQTGQTGSVACTGTDVTACTTAHGDCNARDHRWHCVDQQCRCFTWQG